MRLYRPLRSPGAEGLIPIGIILQIGTPRFPIVRRLRLYFPMEAIALA